MRELAARVSKMSFQGFGVRVDWNSLTEESLSSAIQAVLTNKTFSR